MPDCPYCGAEYSDRRYLYNHALTDHREAVLAYWMEEHGVSPTLSGQQTLGEVAAQP